MKSSMMAGTAAVALLVATSAPAAAGSPACASRNNNTDKKLLECVTLDGVRTHQAAFQEHADENDGNRFAGLPGSDASIDYVAGLFRNAGYAVTVQEFEYLASIELGASALEQVAPTPTVYLQGTDFDLFSNTEGGDVTGAVTPVDLQLGLGNTSTSGCEALDFAGFPAGNIALLQRGTCSFQIKAENADAAGAAGAIIFNQGNTPDRTGLINGTLGEYTGNIPVAEATYALGEEWAGTPSLELRLFANALREPLTTANVLAETRGGRADNIVMVGAHLDSVAEGPGINDNGSGSAAILETALQMKNVNPRNKVRFAWWSAEESGLLGAEYYVANLSNIELANIALYLNFDMVGSPNYVRFIYDGNGDTFGLEGPEGSASIEEYFANFYTARGLQFEPTAFDGRSDYGPFIDSGVASGGLFTGAEEIKTAEQEEIYGGTAGDAFDPCYHQACDDLDNFNAEVLDLNSDAIASVTLQYAMNTQAVNGIKGKGNFKKAKPLKNPERRGSKFLR